MRLQLFGGRYDYIGNDLGPRSLFCIVEVSVIEGIRCLRFHCTSLISGLSKPLSSFACTNSISISIAMLYRFNAQNNEQLSAVATSP